LTFLFFIVLLIEFINELDNLVKVFTDMILLTLHDTDILPQIFYNTHQNVDFCVTIVEASDPVRRHLKAKQTASEVLHSLHLCILIIRLLQVYTSLLESCTQYINCILLKLFFVMQSKQKSVGFFLIRTKGEHVVNCHNEKRHDESAPEANDGSHYSSKDGLRIYVSVSGGR
jgi:hypothetical protein